MFLHTYSCMYIYPYYNYVQTCMSERLYITYTFLYVRIQMKLLRYPEAYL